MVCAVLSLIFYLIPLDYSRSVLSLLVDLGQYHRIFPLLDLLVLPFDLIHTSGISLDLNRGGYSFTFDLVPKAHPIDLFIVESSKVFIIGVPL